MAGHEFEQRVTAEFRAIRTELAPHAEQLRQVDARITAEGEATRRYMDQRLKGDGETIRQYVDERLTGEGEATRRYVDIVAEQFKEYVKVLADGIGVSTESLDDHETRITAIETRRS
jgi:recombinational DNA repair protein RecR